MSEMIPEAPAPVKKNKGGRPRKIRPVDAAPPPPPAAKASASEPEETDGLSPQGEAAILACDLGDVAAREAWTAKSGVPFATRDSFRASMSYLPDLNFPGTIANRYNPTEQHNRAWMEEDGSKHARQIAMAMRQKGWRVATVQDGFILCPELREAIRADDSGRLALTDTNGKSAAVIMVRSKADYARDRKELLRYSDEVQLTAEERAARLQEALRRAGASGVVASSRMEDDHQ